MLVPRLLIPGPVDVDADVLEALGAPVVPHYGAAWGAMYVEMLAALRRVFRTSGTAFAVPGSGTIALDMMMNNLLRPGDVVIVAENGYFGHRLVEIAASYGAQVISIEGAWGEPIDPDAVRAAFRSAGKVTAVAMVHAETSTGIVNPLREVAAIANEHGAAMLADAVTSLGGVELDMDGWGVDFVASGSQKSLAAPAGLGLIGVSERGWQRLAAVPAAERGWYLDLRRWRDYTAETPPWHPHPVTVPPGNIKALHRQLQKIHAIGLDAWLARHTHAAARFRAGLTARGLQALVVGPAAAPMLTITGLPAGSDQQAIVDQLRERYGLYCSGGFGHFQGRALRIGHMGKAASDEYVDAALAALGELFPA
jgi:alanine-glyoxylate transaminase/serine-glyoxylate transaminase/serine-pyruvate transaminase